MKTRKQALILFTRVPEPGKTKTRLMPYYTPEECAGLHTALLKDLAGECRRLTRTGEADLFVCMTPDFPDLTAKQQASFAALFPNGTEFIPQTGEGLGERMDRALQDIFARGYGAAVLFGSDLPDLTARDLRRAFRKLKDCDTVLGPTDDGGYYLIGAKQPCPEAFDHQTYSHSSVLDNTYSAIKAAGKTVGLLAPQSDIDLPEDLSRIRRDLRGSRHLKHSAAGAYIFGHSSISVIVPIYNEESTIEALLNQLAPYRNEVEIILADGGSTDRTAERIGPEWTLIHTEKGRAVQMNTAARQSHGDILFFLHCDSTVPDGFPDDIRRVLKTHPWGAFGIGYAEPEPFLKINAAYANQFRLRVQHIAFGDQGIFLPRELFEDLGGFPELPIMEDYQLSLDLREKHLYPGLAKDRILTSPRRHPKGFVAQNLSFRQYPRLRKMYRDGVDINTIADIYKDIR